MRILSCFILLFIIIYGKSQSLAPTLLSPAGDYFSTANITLNWSLGEVAIETYSNATNTLNQGFHQTSYTITAVEELLDDKLDVVINIFPNPAREFVKIHIENDRYYGKYIIILCDLTGKTLLSKEFTGNDYQLELSGLKESMYILTLSKENKTNHRIYKLIKN